MREQETQIIELKFASIVTYEIIAVVKLSQPETLHTNEVPYIQLILRNAQPLLIPYDTSEERDAEYNIVCESLKTLHA